MTDLLISYARRDRGVAARLAACLADRGLKAVWDISELPEGELVRAAKQRLHAAPAVVVLWSGNSADSEWVIDEASAAGERKALVSASIDGTASSVAGEHPTVDLSQWKSDGAETGLDALISAIAAAASRSFTDAPITATNAAALVQTSPVPALNVAEVNQPAPAKSALMAAAFFVVAFLALLTVAVERQRARTPIALPPISMDATEPLDVTVIPPTPEEENAPSQLRPIPGKSPAASQESTGSVRK